MILDGTIVAILAAGAAELARHAPDIQRAVVDFVREHKDVIISEGKRIAKGPEVKKLEENIKDTAQAALDYVNYNDDAGGWNKK